MKVKLIYEKTDAVKTRKPIRITQMMKTFHLDTAALGIFFILLLSLMPVIKIEASTTVSIGDFKYTFDIEKKNGHSDGYIQIYNVRESYNS